MTALGGIQERLERHSIPVTECGCVIWLGSMGGRRYGSLKVNGRVERAHRVSWTAAKGAIPEGMHVLHRCDVPLCINPDHLFLGTHADNMADKEAKARGNHATGLRNGRHTKPHRTSRGDDHYARKNPGCRRGEKNPRAKLTPQQVLEIRAWTGSQRAAGRRYGVTKTTIKGILTRRLWGHL